MAIGLLALLAIWIAARPSEPDPAEVSGASTRMMPGGEPQSVEEAAGGLPTKFSSRHSVITRPTHSPARLREFYLPAVEIDGLPLAAALEKLRGAYEDACLQAGEVPVPLVFVVPPGVDGVLHVKLPPATFTASLRLLAAVAGMKVVREDAEFRFEPPSTMALPSQVVPPDFLSRLAALSGSPQGTDLAGSLKALGLELDDPGSVSFLAHGHIVFTGSTPADRARVSELIFNLCQGRPLQHKLESKLVQIPAGLEWTVPDKSAMSDDDLQNLVHVLSQIKGVEVMTLQSVTARGGEEATIEVVREIIEPVPGTPNEFEEHKVGVVYRATPHVLAFGHTLDMDLSVTGGDFDPTSMRFVVEEEVRIEGRGYAADGSSRLQVQTHPDGSRTLLVVSPVLVDATGRPVNRAE